NRAHNGMAAMARTPVLPEATLVGALSALLRRSLYAQRWSARDPPLPFHTRRVNGRIAHKERPFQLQATRLMASGIPHRVSSGRRARTGQGRALQREKRKPSPFDGL